MYSVINLLLIKTAGTPRLSQLTPQTPTYTLSGKTGGEIIELYQSRCFYIIQCSIERLNHVGYQLHNIVRCIEFAFFFCCIHSKLFEELFVYTANQVFFEPEGFMRNLIDFINKLLDVISRKTACCESAFNKTAFQRSAAFIEASQCCVQRNI